MGAQYNGRGCVCPAGTKFLDGACRQAEDPSANKDDFCAQYGATFNPQTRKCACPPDAPYNQATKRCGAEGSAQQQCQNGKEWNAARRSCDCPSGQTWEARTRKCQAVDRNAKLQRMVACSTRYGQCVVQSWHAYRPTDRQEARTAAMNQCNRQYQNSCVFILNCDQPSGAVVSKRSGSSYSFPYRQCGGSSPFLTTLRRCGYAYGRPNGCGGAARWGTDESVANAGGGGDPKDGDRDGNGGRDGNKDRDGKGDRSKDGGSGAPPVACTRGQITTGQSPGGKNSGTAWLSGYKCDGPDIRRISWLYSWSSFVGEPGFKHRVQWEMGDHMTIQGQYCKIPPELRSKIKINTVTFQANVSSGGVQTASVEVKLPWIQVAAGSTGQWSAVGSWGSLFVGKGADEAKRIFKAGFHLSNLRIVGIDYLGLPNKCPGAK